eukprot:6107489-Pleurochrysis_carterae.AAC.1
MRIVIVAVDRRMEPSVFKFVLEPESGRCEVSLNKYLTHYFPSYTLYAGNATWGLVVGRNT